jgi:hypothetical protein
MVNQDQPHGRTTPNTAGHVVKIPTNVVEIAIPSDTSMITVKVMLRLRASTDRKKE